MKVGSYIYCDRYFTSSPLIVHILGKKIYITGTITTNRLKDGACKLRNEKLLDARDRGACDVVVAPSKEFVIHMLWRNGVGLYLAPERNCFAEFQTVVRRLHFALSKQVFLLH